MTAIEARTHPLAGLLTVMWHYVREPDESPVVASPGIDPTTFDAQLDLLARHRSIVDWPTVAAALGGGRPLPPDAALLTFDDGLADHARTVAPRLARRGWRGVFFTMARRPGEPLTVGHAIHVLLEALGEDGLRDAVADALPAQAADRFAALQARERAAGVEPIDVLKRPIQRELAETVEPILQRLVAMHLGPSGDVADALHLGPTEVAGLRRERQAIGGHGRHHLWFDHEPPERVAAEITSSAAWLANEPMPWAFAYPYGASGPDSATLLAGVGFAAAFHASPRAATGRYDLGRIDGDDPRSTELIRGSAP